MRKIAFICFNGFQSLDLTGPMEVLDLAKLGGCMKYEIHLLSVSGGYIKSSSGLIVETKELISLEGFDSLIVIGGEQIKSVIKNQCLVSYVRRESQKVKRVVSVCAGAFILAEAGLLDNKRATTHWSLIDEIQRLYPKVEIDDDAIYVNDGSIYSSAGITAGMDLMLSLVEEDCGKKLSRVIAKELVIFYHRPGGQKQFSDFLQSQSIDNHPIQRVCSYIQQNPQKDLTVPQLALIVNMSPRNFSRSFTKELQSSPGKYVETSRVNLARHLLEQNQFTMSQIATQAGINSSDVLCRLFKKHFGVSPMDYKQRFCK